MSKSKTKSGTAVLDKIEATPAPAKTGTKMIPVVKVTKHAQVEAGDVVKGKPGRPAVVGSERQLKLAAQKEKRDAGLLKRGRPAVEGSARQIREAEKKMKKEAGLLTGKQGRPSDPTSARQKKLSTRQAMVDAGIWNGKPGRPANSTQIIEYKEVDINDTRSAIIIEDEAAEVVEAETK